MSVRGLSIVACVLMPIAVAMPAQAQSGGQIDPFFSDKVTEAEKQGEAPDETTIQGSLTSTTFVYREQGGADAAAMMGANDNYSSAMRLYTDLRTQLDAKHISGGSFDARLDGRVRITPQCDFASPVKRYPCRVQSGTFGENEYELRELYIRRAGGKTEFALGRQFVPELASIKIDGARLTQYLGDRWALLGAGGLYPARSSRSLTTDYAGGVMPVAAGAGVAYRYPDVYGSVGAATILPMAKQMDGKSEPMRVFVTGNGYLRVSNKLDLYHFEVIDLMGSNELAITNLSVGGNFQPRPAITMFAGFHMIDTETLNVVAQQYLEDAEAGDAGIYQNNVAVTRISSMSVRGGMSLAFKQQRFEATVSAQVRQRPDVALPAIGGMAPLDPVIFPAAQSADIQLSFVDRRSFKGSRLAANLLRTFGTGNANLRRSTSTIVNVNNTLPFKQGRGQLDANVSYLFSEDEDRGANCLDVLTCFGTSAISTLSVGGTLFYRFKTDWFAVGDLNVGYQSLTTVRDDATTPGRNPEAVPQPANLLLSALVRLAYRF